MNDACEMVVSWKCDDDGNPGEEIECGAQPVAYRSGEVGCCKPCFDTMVKYDADLGRDWVPV